MPVYSVEAPVGGWNARDAQDNLPESDALELVNLIPREGYVESRKRFRAKQGFDPATYGNAGVESMIPTRLASGAPTVIFGVGGILQGYGTGSASSFTSNRWQYANSHGRTIMVNGSDAPQEFDGTTLGAISGIGGSGLTVSDLIGVMPFKGRVFYWEDGATSFWYPGAGEYKNAAMSEYEMNQFLTKGGTLTLAFTWTLDGGAGMDDLAVFVFSSGEVLIYQGSDPGSASDWALVGRFEIGEPLGIRCHCRLGSDHVILTRDGYERISFSLQNGEGLSQKVSDKIEGAVRNAIDLYGENYGWEVHFISSLSLLIVNVPITPVTDFSSHGGTYSYEQHVMNTNTGAWCKWDVGIQTMCESAINASGLDIPETIIYSSGIDAVASGLGTGVWAAFGYYDTTETLDTWWDTTGEPVESFATQVTQFGKRSVRKQITGINFITTFQTPSAIEVTTAADFNTPALPTPTETGNDDSDTVQHSWKIVAEKGYAISYRIGVASGTSAEPEPWKWYATQMTYKVGGPV